jgi:hypothetical protein
MGRFEIHRSRVAAKLEEGLSRAKAGPMTSLKRLTFKIRFWVLTRIDFKYYMKCSVNRLP